MPRRLMPEVPANRNVPRVTSSTEGGPPPPRLPFPSDLTQTLHAAGFIYTHRRKSKTKSDTARLASVFPTALPATWLLFANSHQFRSSMPCARLTRNKCPFTHVPTTDHLLCQPTQPKEETPQRGKHGMRSKNKTSSSYGRVLA